jgi:DNA-directed RNA polymerase I subunit RPA2
MSYLLTTGNLPSPTGLDLMQATGFTIVADKLNFLRFAQFYSKLILRYISHFRCVHRGAFFAEMKTTSVRKLLPEGFGQSLKAHCSLSGFLCPVHTPDGAPCGLLNHLAVKCEVFPNLVPFIYPRLLWVYQTHPPFPACSLPLG